MAQKERMTLETVHEMYELAKRNVCNLVEAKLITDKINMKLVEATNLAASVSKEAYEIVAEFQKRWGVKYALSGTTNNTTKVKMLQDINITAELKEDRRYSGWRKDSSQADMEMKYECYTLIWFVELEVFPTIESIFTYGYVPKNPGLKEGLKLLGVLKQEGYL